MGEIVALGTCYGCHTPFSFDPELVDVILVDPETGLPPDLCSCTRAPDCIDRAQRFPVCPACMQRRSARQGQN